MYTKHDDTPCTDIHPFRHEFGCNICDFVLIGFYSLNLDNNEIWGFASLKYSIISPLEWEFDFN